MKNVVVDPASTSLDFRYAVIYTKRKSRKRFPQGCLMVKDSESAAIDAADETRNLFAATVYGPSTSSEGMQIFYLVNWLT